MIFKAYEIANLDSKFKLNLINSIGGIKSGNLIGTKSSNGGTNLAIFFSNMHLQSNPPLLGLNTYYSVAKIASFPYARIDNIIDF
jgi:hypothetical protein